MFIQKFGFKNTNLAFITFSKKTISSGNSGPGSVFIKKILFNTLIVTRLSNKTNQVVVFYYWIISVKQT